MFCLVHIIIVLNLGQYGRRAVNKILYFMTVKIRPDILDLIKVGLSTNDKQPIYT